MFGRIRLWPPSARTDRNCGSLTPEAEYICDTVIFAAPTMLAKYLMEDAPPVAIQYSPWVTANLTLDRLPRERGLDLAWDNVMFDSPSLGYVVATHMTLKVADRSFRLDMVRGADGRHTAAESSHLLQKPGSIGETIILR